MAYFLFKCWHERLYFVKKEDVRPQKTDLSIKMVPITKENAYLVRALREEAYEARFLEQLSYGDFGYYAYLEDRPVGYGWVKRAGSKDFFFKISKGCAYLCRFFTEESVRGQGIYPVIITELIAHEKETESFYIAVERGNVSSERGLKKVGFAFVKEFGFVRGFKKTLNMKVLRS